MPTWEDVLHGLREKIEDVKREVRALHMNMDRSLPKCKERYPWEARDITANMELAYRALEDARMRMGKALQALDDGVSKYDKSEEA